MQGRPASAAECRGEGAQEGKILRAECHNLGYIAFRSGNSRQARHLFREALELFRDQGDRRGIADCLDGLAGVLAVMGQGERAAELFGAAEAIRQTIGTIVWPANLADNQRGVALLRHSLDTETLDTAWRTGRERPLEGILREILTPEPAVGPTVESGLTAREREVAALVAQGLTNRQIGAKLFITEGTARLHVKHILQKLGFTSRTQIAAWAVEHGLAAASPVHIGKLSRPTADSQTASPGPAGVASGRLSRRIGGCAA